MGSVPGLVADGASSGDGNTEPPKLCQPGSWPWRGIDIEKGGKVIIAIYSFSKQDLRWLTARGNKDYKAEMKTQY